MEKKEIKYPKKSQASMGNTHRLGKTQSIETKFKISLANKGRIPWNKGKNISEETKQKISSSQKGRSNTWMCKPLSIETKNKLSETSKNAWKNPLKRKRMLDRCKWNNISADKGQLELLNKWNKLGFNFEINYQVKTDEDLFYIDGYDKEKNVVFEYDSKYHLKEPQKSKDLIRQNKIINILNPKKFWRYDSVNKQFRNILERMSY